MLKERREWMEGDLYFRQEELSFRDCDVHGRVRPSTLLSFMANGGAQDYKVRGFDYQYLNSIRQVFLLSRAAFKVHRCPVAGETITISTWENGVRGAHMCRNYVLLSEDGRPCVSAKSEWILVDPVDRRILRPSAFTGKVLTSSGRVVDCPECRKVLLPKEGTEPLGEHPVAFSELDHNGHVYSASYGDIIWDALPAELQDAELREFQINYSKEATRGETLTLLGFREEHGYLMEGLCDAERSFTCACRFA